MGSAQLALDRWALDGTWRIDNSKAIHRLRAWAIPTVASRRVEERVLTIVAKERQHGS